MSRKPPKPPCANRVFEFLDSERIHEVRFTVEERIGHHHVLMQFAPKGSLMFADDHVFRVSKTDMPTIRRRHLHEMLQLIRVSHLTHPGANGYAYYKN